MTIYNEPKTIAAILFDMDGTLYTNHEWVQYQIDTLVKKLAETRSTSYEKMQEEVAEYRKNWADSHQGKQISLSTVLKAYGISIAQSVKWREELYEPALYLKPDAKLRETLLNLKMRYKLAVVTNNPVLIARKTLKALGVESCIQIIVGLDTCMETKPHPAPYLEAAKLCETPTETCISVGDRYDIDIALPLTLGMGGILVDGVEDVYELAEKWVGGLTCRSQFSGNAPFNKFDHTRNNSIKENARSLRWEIKSRGAVSLV